MLQSIRYTVPGIPALNSCLGIARFNARNLWNIKETDGYMLIFGYADLNQLKRFVQIWESDFGETGQDICKPRHARRQRLRHLAFFALVDGRL